MNHAEAFCLMTYKCEKCGAIEILWNSRDGVTPFIIMCQHCNGSMQHINWQRDFPIKDLFPIGLRWFTDLTKEKYSKIIEKKINDNPEFVSDGENKEYLIKSIVDDMEEGSPDIMSLDEIKEYVKEKLLC